KGRDDAEDPIERASGRPDFQALVYSGPGGIRGQTITKEMNLPPTFIAVGDDDRFSVILANHYLALKNAGVSAEIHTYAKTPHGLGGGDGEKDKPIYGWIENFYEFLGAEGMLKKS